MAIKLNDLIHTHDDVIDSQTCQFLISMFDNSVDGHERIEKDKKPNFTQFNFTENCNLTEESINIHNYLISKVIEYKNNYYEFVDSRCFPEKNRFEQFRIKRYNNDGNDLFDTHVDVTDYESSRRFLSFIFYLNDVEDGGETVFEDLIISPKIGRLIIFPPLWMYPHKGKAPISNSKYILNTYLHYN
jgi:hypothetical protein